MNYYMTNRAFSRRWRRNKRYSEHELRWLARRYGLQLRERKDEIELSGPCQPVICFKREAVELPLN